MKTLRWYGIRDVRTEELSKPSPGPGEVLVRVAYAGICGSDLHIYNKGMFIQNVPETMGHEFSGVVEEAGEGAEKFRSGDCVAANPMVPCGVCESCRKGDFNTCEALGFIGEVRPGCFAEYIAIPEDRLVRVPEGADLEKMALAEPLAVALNVCDRAELKEEDSLLIIGAGPIGLLTAAAAKQVYGVKHVTVVNRSETRRMIAARLGAETVPSLPGDARFDKTVEAAGNSGTFMMALQHTRAGGMVLPVSVFEEDCTADLNLLVTGQLTVRGSNCYTMAHIERAVGLIAAGKLDISPVITDVVSLDEGKAAFEKLCGKEKKAAKILFKPGED